VKIIVWKLHVHSGSCESAETTIEALQDSKGRRKRLIVAEFLCSGSGFAAGGDSNGWEDPETESGPPGICDSTPL
jgi:hypothetical protein